MGTTTLLPTGLSQKVSLKKVLLSCGIISSLYYVAINVFVAMQYEGYNAASQAVSELSAIDAPTRSLWITLVTIYSILVMAFGWGVWQVAVQNRYLHMVGILMIVNTIIGLFWPPMHQREVLAAGGGTMTDTLHIAWTLITIPLWLLIMGLSAKAFGNRFRIYSIVTTVVLIVFGVKTGMYSSDMEANLPTPWMGVWERISIAAYMSWVIVFAMMLLRGDFIRKVQD
jgi:Protein of unknown function (DUF998)